MNDISGYSIFHIQIFNISYIQERKKIVCVYNIYHIYMHIVLYMYMKLPAINAKFFDLEGIFRYWDQLINCFSISTSTSFRDVLGRIVDQKLVFEK